MPEPMNRREEIARIVDKDAWSISPRTGEMYDMDRMRRERALTKADAIMALPPEEDGVIGELREALKEGRRAIGDHYAPNDCYATGPLTGDAHRDLVECPACSFIAMHDAALARADQALSARQTSDTP